MKPQDRTPSNRGQGTIDERVFRVLRHMRRDHLSLSVAARLEGIKQETVIRYARNALYRSGPGKPWKVTQSDQLAAVMTVVTRFGPTRVTVRSSRERRLLGRYNLVLRMWRARERGATAALMTFRGKTVGGHTLITDTKLLTQLEDAGRLDFDSLYLSVGGGS
jgi:hypothetical protein